MRAISRYVIPVLAVMDREPVSVRLRDVSACRVVSVTVGDVELTPARVGDVLERLRSELLAHECVATVWDLSRLRTPGIRVQWKCLRWAVKHRALVDARSVALAVVVTDASTEHIARILLRQYNPPCAHAVFATSRDAQSFVTQAAHARHARSRSSMVVGCGD